MKVVLSALLGALVGSVLMLGTAQASPSISPVAIHRDAPEFSASGLGTALFVVVGGLLVLAGRRRQQAS